MWGVPLVSPGFGKGSLVFDAHFEGFGLEFDEGGLARVRG